MNRILIIIFLFAPFLGGAQTDTTAAKKYIQLSGIIIDDSLYRVPFATVGDLNTRRGAIADYYGYFALVVHPGDTLIFSSLGYKKKTYVVPDTTSMDFTLVQVLRFDTIMADPVDVYPWPSKEEFGDYFVEMDIADEDIKRTRQRLTYQEMAFVGALMATDGYSSYSASQKEYYQDLYTRGQGPQNNLLNPSAWADFLNGIGTGRYRISP